MPDLLTTDEAATPSERKIYELVANERDEQTITIREPSLPRTLRRHPNAATCYGAERMM